MKFSSPSADFNVPDGTSEDAALERTTHVAIGAHQDDIEIMAYHGILACFRSPDNWLLGVTVTDGAGSPRAGVYAKTTDAEMQAIRKDEQRRAAAIGAYSGIIQLDKPSSAVKDSSDRSVIEDIGRILTAARPGVVYTHNLTDKHDTHVGVSVKAITAMREMDESSRPAAVFGCEVWRNLDWLVDSDKTVLDVSGRENLAAALLGVYDSQIAGGKRYDLATMGRWRANASFFASHDTDSSTGLSFAMDLTPLIKDSRLDICQFVRERMDRLAADVATRIEKVSP